MIKSDAQRDRTIAQIEGFRHALAKVQQTPAKRSAAVRGSYETMIRQLQDELREYDQLKSGELTLPDIERLEQIAPSSPRSALPEAFRKLNWRGAWASASRSSAAMKRVITRP
jgi:hypothetical protein